MFPIDNRILEFLLMFLPMFLLCQLICMMILISNNVLSYVCVLRTWSFLCWRAGLQFFEGGRPVRSCGEEKKRMRKRSEKRWQKQKEGRCKRERESSCSRRKWGMLTGRN